MIIDETNSQYIRNRKDPVILKSEVRSVLSKIKRNKAAGPN